MLKKSLILLILFFSINANAIEKDKVKHVSYSYVIGTGSELYFDNPIKSMTLCSSVGLGKEIYDQIDYNGFDHKDLMYDVIGCGLGVLTGNLINFYVDDKNVFISYNYQF